MSLLYISLTVKDMISFTIHLFLVNKWILIRNSFGLTNLILEDRLKTGKNFSGGIQDGVFPFYRN